MLKFMKALSLDSRGVSALEYAILAAVLLVVIIVGVNLLGDGIEGLFETAAEKISGNSLDRTSGS